MVDKTGMVECAVCGKEFYPAPLHAWKTSECGKLVCSYHCMRQYEVLHAPKKKYATKGK